jgi:hypothetical protein
LHQITVERTLDFLSDVYTANSSRSESKVFSFLSFIANFISLSNDFQLQLSNIVIGNGDIDDDQITVMF